MCALSSPVPYTDLHLQLEITLPSVVCSPLVPIVTVRNCKKLPMRVTKQKESLFPGNELKPHSMKHTSFVLRSPTRPTRGGIVLVAFNRSCAVCSNIDQRQLGNGANTDASPAVTGHHANTVLQLFVCVCVC